MVGSEYQAQIPEGLCKYGDALPYENEDKLLWEPFQLPEPEVLDYLSRAARPPSPLQTPGAATGQVAPLPTGTHHRDDEHALHLLLQCGYSSDEALRRLAMNMAPQPHNAGLWSEEECRNFESGLRTFGKDFHSIHINKVRGVDFFLLKCVIWIFCRLKRDPSVNWCSSIICGRRLSAMICSPTRPDLKRKNTPFTLELRKTRSNQK